MDPGLRQRIPGDPSWAVEMIALLVMALVAFGPRCARAADLTTHTDDVVDVQRASILTAAGLTVEVEGGTWLSDAQTMRTGRELVSLRAQNEALREAPPMPPLWTLAVALGVGLACGVAIGMAGR